MTQQITLCGALAGLMPVLSGCGSTSERSSTQAPKTEATTRSREQLPELNKASGLKDFLAYAARKNPQLEAAFNRRKAALEMMSQAHTLPDPEDTNGATL